MKKRLEYGLRVLVLLLCITKLAAQNSILKTPVSLKLSNHTLAQAFDRLRADYGIQLYYITSQLPSSPSNYNIENAPLDSILEILLSKTDLDYFTYRDYAIIVTTKTIKNTQFTATYYQSLQQGIKDQAEVVQSRIKIIGDIKALTANGKAKVTGTITQQKDKSPIIGATIRVLDNSSGTATDENGKYTLDLAAGKHQLLIQYIGNTDLTQEIQVYSDGTLNLQMESEAVILQEVVVGARAKDANVEQVQIGVTQLDLKSINKIPAFLGEVDVVKSLMLSPGVSSIGEGASGFNVRGGDVDQNLMLQDDGMIFNSSHALGFFSTFHSDLIRNVILYKSIIPAQYGGRLASVLDVELKDGDFEKYHVKAGIGPISSRIAIDGPLIKNKTSFIGGFRSSYTDWVFKQVKNVALKNSSAFFYDANLRLTHRFNDRHSLILAAYASQDDFGYNNSFGFNYGTQNFEAILKNALSKKIFNKLSIVKGNYTSIQSDFSGIDASQLNNDLGFVSVKEQFTYEAKKRFQLTGGIHSTLYNSLPGSQKPLNNVSKIFSKSLAEQKGLETALFVNGEITFSPQLLLSAGLRFSTYQFLGPGKVYIYQNDNERTTNTIRDTVTYNNGTSIASYAYPEPRLSVRWRFNSESSLKIGYSRTVQYLNQIFNSDSPTPTSQYQLSTKYIPPNASHNVSVGYFRNYHENTWETSFEIYGRSIDRLFDYKDFATLIVNDHLETEILSGIGKAYGAELSIKKHKGLLHGLAGYTYSRTFRKVNGINNNKWYPTNFDKPHDLRLVVNYNYNQRKTLTMNFTYSTGRPTTAPQGGYRLLNGLPVPIYSARNALRIPDYHRLDVAYTMGKGYRNDKKLKTSWTISLYNVYARKNAFSVYFTQSPFTAAQANKLAILGTIFPSLTFNIETQ